MIIIIVLEDSPINDIIKWPTIIFAVKRTDKDPGRIKLLIVSIITIIGINKLGVPIGVRWENIELVLLIQPNIINDNHIGNAKVKENTKWEVDVNT